jgi:5-formyltetrahydrofolate cyclo-ligase
MTKVELRARMQRVLAALDARELGRRSALAAGRFQEIQAWKDAQVVLCFLSMPQELDSATLIRATQSAGRRVAVPRIEGEIIRFFFLPGNAGDLPRDRWGIPVPRAEWEPWTLRRGIRTIVATPGLAFDRSGNRLGRGKGYYDSFLREARATLGEKITAIGICFSDQLVDEVPHNERDQRMDGVITERESIAVS